MRNLKASILTFFLLAGGLAEACTAFDMDQPGHVVTGKSYDWFVGHDHGAVYVNPRGVKRTALNLDNLPNPAKWTSRFGSVTFTQFGRGFPIGGMNEKGLVVEMLELDNSIYNESAPAPFVNEAQFTQYQLDNFGSVAQVLENLNSVRVVQAFAGIHYFISDASGDAATIDFLNGQAVVHHAANLPYKALSNDSYDDLMKYTQENGLTGLPVAAWRRTSELRFQIAAQMEQDTRGDLLARAWKILDSVRIDGWVRDAFFEPSQWNLVYDLKQKTIYFRTRKASEIKSLRLADVDFTREQMMDINLLEAGDSRAQLEPFSREKNRELIEQNYWLIEERKRTGAAEHDLP